jgi:hypothetical protein
MKTTTELQPNTEEICAICLDPCNGKPWVKPHRHDGFHKDCLIKWLLTNPQCPLCKEIIDINAYYTKLEQAFYKTKHIFSSQAVEEKAVFVAVVLGLVVLGRLPI